MGLSEAGGSKILPARMLIQVFLYMRSALSYDFQSRSNLSYMACIPSP